MTNQEIFTIVDLKSDSVAITHKMLTECMNEARKDEAEQVIDWLVNTGLTAYSKEYILEQYEQIK